MSSSKPGIVIVPGAWHHPSQYILLHNGLAQAGYKVTTCDLPSTGGKVPQDDFWPDVAVIKEAITSHLDGGRNVVIVMHSMGGPSGTAAAQDLRPQDGKDGKGVVGLVYLAAFVTDVGDPAFTGKHAPFVEYPLPSPEDAGFAGVKDPASVFYNCCSPDVQDENVAKLRLLSERVTHSPQSDAAVPVQVQEMLSNVAGGEWKRVERLPADHSPFLSYPEETVAFVRRCAGEDV